MARQRMRKVELIKPDMTVNGPLNSIFAPTQPNTMQTFNERVAEEYKPVREQELDRTTFYGHGIQSFKTKSGKRFNARFTEQQAFQYSTSDQDEIDTLRAHGYQEKVKE